MGKLVSKELRRLQFMTSLKRKLITVSALDSDVYFKFRFSVKRKAGGCTPSYVSNFDTRFSSPSSFQGSNYLRQSKDKWPRLKVDGPTDVKSIAIKVKVKSNFIDMMLRNSYFLSPRRNVIWAFYSVTNLKLLRSNSRLGHCGLR